MTTERLILTITHEDPLYPDGLAAGVAAILSSRVKASVTVTPQIPCHDPIGCYCWCHVTVDTHIPVCRHCHVILQRSEKNPHWGVCRTIGCVNDNMPVWPHDWAWKARDMYDLGDLPPANGNLPIDITLPLEAGSLVL